MTLTARLSVLCLALAGLMVTSCTITSKGPGGAIDKVKYYNLQPQEILRSKDPALQFERSYRLYGAYTAAEQISRTGEYFDILWRADDRSQPVTVRFEYRQERTALAVKKQEIEVTDVRKRNTTEFKVIGPDFVAGGRVTAWRMTLVRGKEEIASQNSYLWK